ncbi:MAG: hypothetical protein M3494_01600 [Actinomycetota bacterium]|nr:hypothetical protein [Rubrobacter sp.]MDQ3506702.1 hypothetical protein [Actinomycetota bacterium]
MEAVILSIAVNLASTLLVAGGRRVAEEALGDEQEQALRDAFSGATAAMLVEIARHAGLDRNLPGRLEEQFGKFFEDRWVAETLVDIALRSRIPPVDDLGSRYERLGFDPGALPMGFERAMRVLAHELAVRLREDARAGGPLAGVVLVADVEAMRGMLEGLVRARGATGPDVDEIERESLARCAERWEAAGLSSEEARVLAEDRSVGAPGSWLRAELGGRPLAVLSAEVGAGKSLLADRLLQRAVVRLREEPGASLPAHVEAWEVEGRLRDVVLEKTASLGDARVRGAAVFLDGAEEEGSARAGRLVKQARILASTWPNTTVVVAGRPLPELAEDRERVEAPQLTEDEAFLLIGAITGEEPKVATTHRWPESVKEAIRRPLFAVLVASDMRERGSWNPSSTGEMLTGLVERALRRSGNVVDTARLRELAVAVMDRGGAPVPEGRGGNGREREGDARHVTGLVVRRGNAVAFPLRILAEWFASEALEHGLAEVRDLASDLARLEGWRYPLAMAVGNFGYARASEVLRPVVEAAPAFASQIVETGLEREYVSFRMGRGGPPMSPEEFGRRLREAMNSWVKGMGPLAPLIAPVREDGSLSTLGVSGSAEQASQRFWYRGEEDLGDVVELPDHNPEMLPNWEWPSLRGVGTHEQAAWTWEYALEDLRSELSKKLKKRRLPIGGGLLAEEAAWDAAWEMRKRFDKKNYREREPIPLDAVEGYLDFVGRDTDAITFGNQWSQRGPNYELKYLKDKLRDSRAAGRSELRAPWPMHDRMPGDPGYVKTDRDSAWVWERYSDEALLRRARVILEGALDGYRRFVEEFFLRLAPHMVIAATLPARLTGTLILTPREGRPGVGSYVSWHLEPLPYGSENEVRVAFGHERPGRDYMLGVGSRTRSLRPQAAAWISPYDYATGDFYGRTPATELAYKWLWEDLRRVSWLDDTFNRRSW